MEKIANKLDRISKTETLAHEINCAAHLPGSPFEATVHIPHVDVQVYDAMGNTMFWLKFHCDCQPKAALNVIRGAIAGLIGMTVGE